jgi:glutaredoxin
VTIDIYSKEGCGICNAAKDKLARMGLEYSSHDLQTTIEPHQGWRSDGSVDVLAAYALIGNKLPVIRINDEFHDYPSAMRRLKSLRSQGGNGSGSEQTH